MSSRPSDFEAFPAGLGDLVRYGPYAGTIRRVVDGDTVRVLVDVGFGAYHLISVRLRGVNAPERGTPEGQAARRYLTELLAGWCPVVLTTYKDPLTFGRYVADITLATRATGEPFDLAAHLVEMGVAVRSEWKR